MSSTASACAPCAACGEETSLVCAACLITHFCSRPCAAKAWAGHRSACAEFSVLAELPDETLAPVPPAAPLASMEPAAGAGAGAFEHPGTGFECAVCGKADAAVCARCRLVGYCGAEHQRKDWPAHKSVCRKGETRVVPVLSWEQRMLAEAHAASPASLAATAALPTIPFWDFARNGAPPTKIIRAWRKLAESGHAEAQFDLGYCYGFGTGVAKDAVAAAEWYAKAAAQGHASAQCNLGILFESGKGVAQDFKTAATWYAKAAMQGHFGAQNNLGVFYYIGKGVAQDYNASAAWYAKAAAQGFADAQCNLGLLHENGTGFAQGFKTAAAWYAKAAAQGHANAQHNLGVLYNNGSGLAQDFKASAAFFAKAAAQEYAISQFSLGVLYENGTGVTQDFKAAAAWYAKAAAQGVSNAPAARDACLARAAAAAASRP
jgi:TPR repeat protein